MESGDGPNTGSASGSGSGSGSESRVQAIITTFRNFITGRFIKMGMVALDRDRLI